MNNYLAHHGVKGQRWGFRRYQNPDGTLTDEGRKRYGYRSRAEFDRRIQRDMLKVRDYTDEDLDREIARLEKEVKALDLSQKVRDSVKNKPSANREKKESELKKTLREASKKLFVDTTVDITAQAIKHCLSVETNAVLNKSKRWGPKKSKKSTDSTGSESEESDFKEFVFANNKKK